MNTAIRLTKDIAKPSVLRFLTGPDSGKTYQLSENTVSLGREAGCDVVLKDTRASRTHIKIEKRGAQYWVKDLKSQNGTMINGKILNGDIVLNSGDRIMIGSTMIQFDGGPAAPLSVVAAPSEYQVPPAPKENAGFSMPLTKMVPKKESSNFIVLVVGVVIIGGVFFFLQKSKNSVRTGLDLKDDAAIDKTIQNATTSNEKLEEDIQKKGKRSQQYAEAQGYFLRGFRDYREQNFSRAIQSFDTSLILYPPHILARKYRDLSRQRLDEKITESLRRGEKYFELKNYQMALNEYRSVIILTNDLNNKSAQLANKRIETITLLLTDSK